MIAPACYIDGPPLSAATRRDAVKARMVNDLLDAGITDRGRARRLLYARDFLQFDIELLVDEALGEARQYLRQMQATADAMADAIAEKLFPARAREIATVMTEARKEPTP